MTQKPLTITRLPKDIDLPPALRTGASTALSGAVPCQTCGAYMADVAMHMDYHHRIGRWTRRVNSVLNIAVRVLIARGDIPANENTMPVDGDITTASEKPQDPKGAPAEGNTPATDGDKDSNTAAIESEEQ